MRINPHGGVSFPTDGLVSGKLLLKRRLVPQKTFPHSRRQYTLFLLTLGDRYLRICFTSDGNAQFSSVCAICAFYPVIFVGDLNKEIGLGTHFRSYIFPGSNLFTDLAKSVDTNAICSRVLWRFYSCRQVDLAVERKHQQNERKCSIQMPEIQK